MAKLTILEFPDPRLRTKAQPVETVDDALRQLIDDMFETMYAAPGIGLAATQVNVHKRVIVIDISETRDQPLVLINPEILAREGVEEMEEGCLSVPGIYDKVKRAEKIRVRTFGSRRANARVRCRWAARGVHPARDRSSRRQALRRLSLGSQAHAHSQEARKGTQRARCERAHQGDGVSYRPGHGRAPRTRASFLEGRIFLVKRR